MDVDQLFREIESIERRLEDVRDDVTGLDPHVLGAGEDESHRVQADRRQMARHLHNMEAGITKASRAARDARHVLRSYATPTVTEDDDLDPSEEVDA